MIRLIKADFYRLFHSKEFYLTLLAIVVMTVITISTNFFPITGPDKETYNMMIEIKNATWDSKIAFQGALAASVFLCHLFIVFFILVSSYEFSQKNYKNTLISGVSRFTFVLSKNVTQLLVVMLATALYFISTFIFSFFKFGMTGINVGALIKDMAFATLCIALSISLILSIANMLLIITNSSVIAIVFVFVFPLMIMTSYWNSNWHWISYFDFFSIVQNMAFYRLSGAALIPHIMASFGLIIGSTILSAGVINQKEF